MAEKERKNNRTRRGTAAEKGARQQDQVLSGAQEAPKIGKIAGPKKAERSSQRTRGKAAEKKGEPKRAEAKKPESKPAEKAAGRKKAESARKPSSRGGRRSQKPVPVSYTHLDVYKRQG